MQLTEAQIAEFQALCLREVGIDLSPVQAAAELERLILFVRALLALP